MLRTACKWSVLAVMSAMGVVACGGSSSSEGIGSANEVRFLVAGDTGTGCEEGAQCAVASVMEQVCAARGCDFAIVTGDNIYEDGVDGVDDEQFQTKFEEPYADLDMPFYMVLGNHDVSFLIGGDSGNQSRGDFQVEYHYASEAQKWRMPARFYTKRFPPNADEPLLELFALDSAALTRFVEDFDPNWSGAGFDAYLMEQRQFMQNAIAASPARWKIAAAHHGYISNGSEHGNAGAYQQDSATPDLCFAEQLGEILGSLTSFDDVDDLILGIIPPPADVLPAPVSNSCRGKQYKQFLEDTVCDEVDFFFAGHDHDLQWLEPNADCGKTQHIVSGAGAKMRAANPDRNPSFYTQGDVYGFMWVEMVGDTMTGSFFIANADGTPAEVNEAGEPVPAFTKAISRQP